MKITIITDILLMYTTVLLYAIPIINTYNSIKTGQIEWLLFNILYLTALTVNLILTFETTWNNRLTTANILLTLSLSIVIIPLGLKPTTPDLLTKVTTYLFPTLYSLITITYNLMHNKNFVKWIKKGTPVYNP
ncbi:hypothetical protein [Thermococcus piezophilus]|uniref:Uncharacterized protein n=1 Tax=Thermococcus piezophilus TaxID=1712654 RepID=A0A172WF95_9EURY|nr:hypothetical protein [Thermococcus piezophilus]ANF22092.1 hypothetical protein A7C91_01975 [Thermococcus piezophilus]